MAALVLVLVSIVHIGQRQRQIGALRALGAPRGAVFALVWAGLFALILCGMTLGLACGHAAARLLSARIGARQGLGSGPIDHPLAA